MDDYDGQAGIAAEEAEMTDKPALAREALSRPEPVAVSEEPVAWRWRFNKYQIWHLTMDAGHAHYRTATGECVVEPLYASPSPPASERDSDEAYEIGKRDGYEKAIQDLDLATGGDGEFKGSTFPSETVDVPVMKARIIERFGPASEREKILEEGWFLPASSISEPARESLNEAIAEAKQSHVADLVLRFGGVKKLHEADWVKYLRPVGNTNGR